tara:strand:+ start:62 stop:292 length:231 start_codon:yes stop_codon:yes gene_type:complete
VNFYALLATEQIQSRHDLERLKHARALRELHFDTANYRLMKPDRLRDWILIWAEEEMRAGTPPAKSREQAAVLSPP